MASACVKSFEPGVTRNNFVAEVTVTLVSASASVAMVNDSLPIALIVPKTGGVFAGAAVGVPVCASVQTTLISASQRQAPARTALPAKTLRVSNRSICINSPRVPSRGREREAAWTLRCRAGKTYRLDADKGVSRFIELHRCTGLQPVLFALFFSAYSALFLSARRLPRPGRGVKSGSSLFTSPQSLPPNPHPLPPRAKPS